MEDALHDMRLVLKAKPLREHKRAQLIQILLIWACYDWDAVAHQSVIESRINHNLTLVLGSGAIEHGEHSPDKPLIESWNSQRLEMVTCA